MRQPLRWIRIMPLIMLCAVFVPTAHAFEFAGAGGKIGMLDPEGGNAAPAIGGHLEFEQPGTRWHLMPSLMFWNSHAMTGVSANMDAYYHFGSDNSATPYLGAGVGINHFSPTGDEDANTRLGMNLFGGLRFPMRLGHIFMEGRYTATRFSQLSIMGGVTFFEH